MKEILYKHKFIIAVIIAVVVDIGIGIFIHISYAIQFMQIIIAAIAAYIAFSYNNNAKNQRKLYMLQVKREYYNKFIEVLMRKLFYRNYECIESIRANEDFCIEVNRLPLYASKEVIDYVNKIYNGEERSPIHLLLLIRKDLDMSDLSNLSLNPQLPNIVLTKKIIDEEITRF